MTRSLSSRGKASAKYVNCDISTDTFYLALIDADIAQEVGLRKTAGIRMILLDVMPAIYAKHLIPSVANDEHHLSFSRKIIITSP